MATTLLRTSERTTYKRCRQKWDWAYNARLISKHTKPALRFGDLVHQALAVYYKPGKRRGVHPAKTFLKLYDADLERESSFGIREEEEWVDARELGEAVLTHYVDTYGRDAAIEVIAPEHVAWVKIKDAGGKPVLYLMRFDAVIRDITSGELGLFEHKTASSIKDEHLALDEQAGSYWAFAPIHLRRTGVLKRGQDLDMILYNYLRKARPDPRPTDSRGHYLNKDGSVSKRQPLPFFERMPVYRDEPDRRQVLRRIRLESWEMRLAREGKLPIYKTPMDTCRWQCQFYDMCELHETGSDWKEFARQLYTVGDPYEDYREDLEKEGVKV